MATTKHTKRRRAPRSKRASAALLASTAAVRKGKPSHARPRTMRTDVLNPAVAMLKFMARVTAVYAELPSRLIQCRSPMDLWREQARFAAQIFSESVASTLSPTRPRSERKSR